MNLVWLIGELSLLSFAILANSSTMLSSKFFFDSLRNLFTKKLATNSSQDGMFADIDTPAPKNNATL